MELEDISEKLHDAVLRLNVDEKARLDEIIISGEYIASEKITSRDGSYGFLSSKC